MGLVFVLYALKFLVEHILAVKQQVGVVVETHLLCVLDQEGQVRDRAAAHKADALVVDLLGVLGVHAALVQHVQVQRLLVIEGQRVVRRVQQILQHQDFAAVLA